MIWMCPECCFWLALLPSLPLAGIAATAVGEHGVSPGPSRVTHALLGTPVDSFVLSTGESLLLRVPVALHHLYCIVVLSGS